MLLRCKGDLLKVIQYQEEIITKQNELIADLANENVEQENMINVLIQEHID